VASRRGYRGPRRKQQTAKSLALTAARQTAAIYDPLMLGMDHTSSTLPSSYTIPSFDANGLYSNFNFDGTYGFSADALNYAITPFPTRNPTFRDEYFESFYRHFHASHPFVLPKDYFLSTANNMPSIGPLQAAMRWIGSIFVDPPSTSNKLLDFAYGLVYKADSVRDGFMVQAMLLLIIGLDGFRQRDKVYGMLTDVQNLAVQIGMNRRWFAAVHGQGMPVLEESWRRTWWDLYIVDAMIAGVHRSTNFWSYTVEVDAALPCEEYQYLTGVCYTLS
jgi:hypothetical protein